jgi:hypothetical protein
MRILILSLIFPVIIFHKSYNESTGYIMISYTGDVTKPHPIVIFDHFGNFDTTYLDITNLFFIHKFQVKERKLLDLKQTIHQREIIFNNDTLRDALAIRIVIDEQDNIIFIKGREEISRLFKRIIDQWRESDKADVKSQLDQLSRGVGAAIITD